MGQLPGSFRIPLFNNCSSTVDGKQKSRSRAVYPIIYLGVPYRFRTVVLTSPDFERTINRKCITPAKTNIEPENHPVEKENHLPNLHFLGSMLVFRGVSPYISIRDLSQLPLVLWDKHIDRKGRDEFIRKTQAVEMATQRHSLGMCLFFQDCVGLETG